MSRAMQLKEEGNSHFHSGDFAGADSLYSKAILADPRSASLYTNRAMARLRLGFWDSVIADCNTCLSLTPSSMKARYCLAQAQLAVGDYDAALDNARAAHDMCAAEGDRSLAKVTAVVLRCKKERWEHRERRRTREARELERELLELLERRRDELLLGVRGGGADVADTDADVDMDAAMDRAEQDAIRQESAHKTALLRDMFERARAQSDKRRQVPEWAVDDISFGIMVDPVITKTGKSYERASIMEHLRRHSSDPLTREPLVAAELRPNLALRSACDEFLEHNG